MQVQRAVWQSSEHASLWLMVTLRRLCFEYQSLLCSPPSFSTGVSHGAVGFSNVKCSRGGDISQPWMGGKSCKTGYKLSDSISIVCRWGFSVPFGVFSWRQTHASFADGTLKQKVSWRRGGNCLLLFYFRRKVHNSASCDVCKMIISSKGGKAVKQHPHTLFYAPWVFMGKTCAYVKKKK